jgi:hypothetical protein
MSLARVTDYSWCTRPVDASFGNNYIHMLPLPLACRSPAYFLVARMACHKPCIFPHEWPGFFGYATS